MAASSEGLLAASSTYSLRAVILIFLVPALGGFLFGYDIGATSYVVVQLIQPNVAHVPWSETVQASAPWQGVIVSAASFGALLGSTLVFLGGLGDKFGRKRELQAGSLLYMTGALLESLSIFDATQGLALLMMGRLIYGVGIGITMHAAPTYLGEMGPAPIRGLLVSLKEASIVLGILCGYIIGYLLSDTVGGWSYVYGLSMAVSFLMFFLSFTIPRSCRWLLLKGLDEEAQDSLAFVYPTDAQQEFDDMKALHDASLDRSFHNGDDDALRSSSSAQGRSASIWDTRYRAPLKAGLGLVVLQQITGQPSVLSYTTEIFEAVGVSSFSAILVAIWKLFATVSAAAAVERYGRKILLYTGCSAMLIALMILAMVIDGDQSTFGRALVLIAFFVYIGGYQTGFGPISWLLTSEIFPLEVRGQAVAFAVQMNFLLNTLVQLGVPILEHEIGLGRTFAIFALLDAYR
jgi:sugar porter (SP) family MFS transporter